MALIKTDNQNYIGIANALREIGIKTTFFDKDITTSLKDNGDIKYNGSENPCFIDNVQKRLNEVFVVKYNDVEYLCELKKFSETLSYETSSMTFSYYYLGNLSLSSPISSDTVVFPDTEENFCIFFMGLEDLIGVANFYTAQAGTHHFTVIKKHYKPEEMTSALSSYFPEYGVSYVESTESGGGYIATTYGTKVGGFNSNKFLDEVIISPKAKEILPRAFYECSFLRKPTIPNGVEIIGNYAFAYCDNFSSITLPESIDVIENRAFTECDYLTTVTFNGTPSNLSDTVFRGCDRLTTINVPWAEGAVANAPWGATSATINYNYVASTEV